LSSNTRFLQPPTKTIKNHWALILIEAKLPCQLTWTETTDDKICYKSKPSKIKNTIIIERHQKYLISIHLTLTCQKTITIFYIENKRKKLENLIIQKIKKNSSNKKTKKNKIIQNKKINMIKIKLTKKIIYVRIPYRVFICEVCGTAHLYKSM
jgi:hypothetical protein